MLHDLCLDCKFLSPPGPFFFYHQCSSSLNTSCCNQLYGCCKHFLLSETCGPEASILFSISCVCVQEHGLLGIRDWGITRSSQEYFSSLYSVQWGWVVMVVCAWRDQSWRIWKAIIVVHSPPLYSLFFACLHELYGCFHQRARLLFECFSFFSFAFVLRLFGSEKEYAGRCCVQMPCVL